MGDDTSRGNYMKKKKFVKNKHSNRPAGATSAWGGGGKKIEEGNKVQKKKLGCHKRKDVGGLI